MQPLVGRYPLRTLRFPKPTSFSAAGDPRIGCNADGARMYPGAVSHFESGRCAMGATRRVVLKLPEEDAALLDRHGHPI